MNTNYLSESEWDGATFHQYRLHEIRLRMNNSYRRGEWKELNNTLNVYKNEIIMVMNKESVEKYHALMLGAQKSFAKGNNPSNDYDKVIEFLTIAQNEGGLLIKRKRNLAGNTRNT